MGKFTRREFQCGEWYIGQRENSPAFYRCRYDKPTRSTQRISLGVTDFREACEKLSTWYFENLRLEADSIAPEKMPLANVLLDYWNNHAQNLASAPSRKILLRYWNEFWGEATVADVRSVPRQEEFQRWLAAKGLNVGSVNRTLEVGAAAMNRAWKRGVVSSTPFVHKVPDKRDLRDIKKGADITLDELRAFYRGSESTHWHDMFVIMIGTACRPEAARQLTREQIDFDLNLVHLNPKGRLQTAKHRPTVKLPPTMRSRFLDRPAGPLVLWRGQPMAKNEHMMRAARKRAGLDRGVNFYSLRHFCARWMRMHGVDPWTVAAQLGHGMGGKLTVTERYSHADPTYMRASCDALEQLLVAMCAPNTGNMMPKTPTL